MSTPAMWGSLRVADRQRREVLRSTDRIALASVDVESLGLEPVLRLTFLGRTPAGLDPANILVLAPPGSPALRAVSVDRRSGEDTTPEHLTVRLGRAGGAGTHRLRLVERERDGGPGQRVLRGADPRFAELAFTFDVSRPVPGPPDARPLPRPEVFDDPGSYLARDYAGLRRLLLDRLAVTRPQVAEEHAADLTVMLAELFAYLGDDLAYRQDDAGTEAYLATARRRISVRRHGRLVGYRLHQGAAARAWVTLQVTEPVTVPLAALRFLAPAAPGSGTRPVVFTPVGVAPDLSTGPSARLRPAHGDISLHSYGEHDSVLCAGATAVTLVDGALVAREPLTRDRSPAKARRVLDLRVGDVLVLEALTDAAGVGRADPAARHAVRLTSVHRRVDALLGQDLVEVRWSAEDALPFDLPVSTTTPTGAVVRSAHACGNVVLLTQGEPVAEVLAADSLQLAHPGLSWSTPFPDDHDVARHQARQLRRLTERARDLLRTWQHLADHGEPLDEAALGWVARLFGPRVDELPVGDTVEVAWLQAGVLSELLAGLDRLLEVRGRRAEQLARRCDSFGALPPELLDEVARDWGEAVAALLDPRSPSCWGPAAEAFPADPRTARPVLVLNAQPASTDPTDVVGPAGGSWTAVPDLLRTAPGERQLVVEVDDADRAQLRLAPRTALPASGTFQAHYRVGNGVAGNVPADAITVVADAGPAAVSRLVTGVRNPLPAAGGSDPEDVEAARRAIPGSFAVDQPRALSAADYVAQAERLPGVGRAAAALGVHGSRRLVTVAVQPTGGSDPSSWFLREVARGLSRVRRLGDEVRVVAPQYRPLYLRVEVTSSRPEAVEDLHLRVAALLGRGDGVPGSPALFHPSRLEFGATLWASAIVAAVQGLTDVLDVVLLDWGCLPLPATLPVRPPDRLRFTGLQLPRLDNDPVHRDRGQALVSVRSRR